MRLRYTAMPAWPPLAWLARLTPGDTVDVFHGSDVAIKQEWFGEAVWDGPYPLGDMDHTDVVFGSGGRLRWGLLGSSVTFVSSASTVDRLQSMTACGATWVSNSLVCLLATVGASVDPAYPAYFRDFKSITAGLARYTRTLATSEGEIRFTYYHNLVWDGQSLREVTKPRPARSFASFPSYRAFLESSLARLMENASAPGRSFVFDPLGTISSGYDSATVAALARPGLREAIAFDRSGSGEQDSGAAIAAALDIRLTVIERDAWRATTLPEVPFLSADAKGEDVYFSSAAAQLKRRLLLTGFHGDRVWSTRGQGDHLTRGDQSGLSLTEYRLWAGFVHCPVPFLGARNIDEISAISRSEAMARWSTGSRYSRPICRRVLEESGVSGEHFGQSKKAASVLFFKSDGRLSESARQDYGAWLERHGLSPARWSSVRRWAVAARSLLPSGPHDHRYRPLFPWAMEHAMERYARVPQPYELVGAVP